MSSSSRNRAIILIVFPIVLVLLALLVGSIAYSKYTRGIYIVLAALLVADIAVALRGRWRDLATIVATLVFGFAAIELGSAALQRDIAGETKGFSVSRPVLGWGPSAPGVYHGERRGEDGTFIYSADYTIDDHLLRKTVSAASGPTVAFFGNSMTFGQGLADADTLPQAFADLTGRKMRVLNFGFPGYGPQQFLRALETGLFDPLLANAKVFVYETAAWHVERAACTAGFVARAPRYDLRDGKPVFAGACAEGLKRILTDVFVSSAAFHRFISPVASTPSAADVELYIAELTRSNELVKAKYGAPLVILYLSESDAYLAKSGYTDAKIKKRLQDAGVDVVDASLSPADFPPGTLLAIPGDGHPTAAANRARAALLQKHLAEQTSTLAASPAQN